MPAISFAATIPNSAEIVFIIDESGSMAGEQEFIRNTVIPELQNELTSVGVASIEYAIIGFGNSGTNLIRTVSPLSDAATAVNNAANLVASGSLEDGYAALSFAFDNLVLDADAKNFILVTDEDRDVTTSDDFASVAAELASNGVILNAILNNPLANDDGDRALGLSSDTAFEADGAGGFIESAIAGGDPIGSGNVGNGFGSTETDYVPLALGTGGAVWDLNLLRSGGLPAASFTDAFIDIKVSEIVGQPIDPTPSVPAVPLPASAWLILGGLSTLVGLRKARKA